MIHNKINKEKGLSHSKRVLDIYISSTKQSEQKYITQENKRKRRIKKEQYEYALNLKHKLPKSTNLGNIKLCHPVC